ncbi:glutamine--tRNA ligase [Clostridia bacterium]|nr:glutamine--tRNA ligase [Clostridia bacterium]GHU57538.1 glutamine--tRNA ligase [Clostridia bacterium]
MSDTNATAVLPNENFIHDFIDATLAENPGTAVHTRFPPEPNGYLHIGSAKAIWINYTAAKKYGGLFNLRYDDTNPEKEDTEYVDAIYNDVKWLIGGEPSGGVFYGSDYAAEYEAFAGWLIRRGEAYVCDLSAEAVREYRGTLTEPGRNSPYRDRSPETNLALWEKMKSGELADGACVLRAKIDMSSGNINMRDPAIYRILHAVHHRQGGDTCVYPLYDYAHPIQDSIEDITFSLCSLEFEAHRPLYDWVAVRFQEYRGSSLLPVQREFARLNLTYTVMSKRYLRKLVEEGYVDGWDDPRMPTLSGLRRRGYTASSILEFVRRAGVSKGYSIVDYASLEACIRDELNVTAARRVMVLEPLRVVIDNFDELDFGGDGGGGSVSGDIAASVACVFPNNPNDKEAGTRTLPLTREVWIERSDFAAVPPPKFFRLKPGGEVRLMNAVIVKYESYDESRDTLHVTAEVSDRKVKGTIHWLSTAAADSVNAVHFGRLFNTADMNAVENYDEHLNRDSKTVVTGAFIERGVDTAAAPVIQAVRNGYYKYDPGTESWLRVVALKSAF